LHFQSDTADAGRFPARNRRRPDFPVASNFQRAIFGAFSQSFSVNFQPVYGGRKRRREEV